VRATWAPRGRTPVICHRFNWKRASIAAAICYRPDASSARLAFGVHAGAYNDDALIAFLTQLRRHLRGDKATLCWDGLPSHRSRKMRAFLARQRHWLVVEALPAYAPDLNPVEGLWGNLKGRELANFTTDTLDETINAVTGGITRIRRRPNLLFALLDHTGLFL
jgi:transposase